LTRGELSRRGLRRRGRTRELPSPSQTVRPVLHLIPQIQLADCLLELVVGGVQGLNQAAQCVGAILIAPLVKRWPTRTVLAAAILMFSLTAAILLIVDVGTGEWLPVVPHNSCSPST
jgi:MFS family permease